MKKQRRGLDRCDPLHDGWRSLKGQENDKRLHTTPEDWKYKRIKWMSADVPGTRLQMMRAQGPGGVLFPSSPE